MKKLKPEFVKALYKLVYDNSKYVIRWNKIESCIDDLEDQANGRENIFCITLVSDPETPLQFIQGYTTVLHINGKIFKIIALADKDFIEVEND